MDVEKTIQAILESQLRAEKRADRADERMDRAEKRADRFDKQLNATRNLVQKGMQFILKGNAEFRFKINALIDAQHRTEAALRKTDEKFNRWLETLNRKNANGHKK